MMATWVRWTISSWTTRVGCCAIWSRIRVAGGRANMCWCRHAGAHRCVGPSRASWSTFCARRSRQDRSTTPSRCSIGRPRPGSTRGSSARHTGRRPSGSPAGEHRDPPADTPRSVCWAARGHGVLSRDSGFRYQPVDIYPNARTGVALLSSSVLISLFQP